jgi:hypothetical protein
MQLVAAPSPSCCHNSTAGSRGEKKALGTTRETAPARESDMRDRSRPSPWSEWARAMLVVVGVGGLVATAGVAEGLVVSRGGLVSRSCLLPTASRAPSRQAGRSSPSMLWSGGRRTGADEVAVNIERTSMNSRRISGSVIIDRPIEDVWLVLTDYDRLADYVPNLTQSKTVAHPQGGIRLFQEGSQKIVGFDFRASLTMDMEEHYGNVGDRMAMRSIKFKLVDSGMFGDFDGEWRLQYNSRIVNRDAKPGEDPYVYRTKLFYMVYIRPKGPVPVVALEWQIAEEVPNNLRSVKKTAEEMGPEFYRQRRDSMASRSLQSGVIVNGEPLVQKGAVQSAEYRNRRPAAVNPAPSPVPKQTIAVVSSEGGVSPGRNVSEGVDTARDDWQQDETLEAYFSKLVNARDRR